MPRLHPRSYWLSSGSEATIATVGNPGARDLDLEAAKSPEEIYRDAADLLPQRDDALIKAWTDQADGLVTFAALFSGVVTAFIIDSNADLKPDQTAIIVALLRQISAQLSGQQNVTMITTDNQFVPPLSAVVRNALLYASLICSLLAAGLGVFHKEWLREYVLYLPLDPQYRLRALQHRHEGRKRFKLWFTIASISIFLQLGVALFIGAILIAVWPLHPVLRDILGTFLLIWFAFWVGTAFLPTFWSNCPFKSPLARIIFVVLHLPSHLIRIVFTQAKSGRRGPWHWLPTLEDHELREIKDKERGPALERDALFYLATAYQGDRRLQGLSQIAHQLPPAKAQSLQEMLGPRFPSSWASTPKLNASATVPSDNDVHASAVSNPQNEPHHAH
ncbi:hypothetical protein FKP32DRAFT_15686 [Trametes sanguinea]|nr:hypothetical protein FKP32DRAFT_15686 [Trametes sanguinea]